MKIWSSSFAIHVFSLATVREHYLSRVSIWGSCQLVVSLYLQTCIRWIDEFMLWNVQLLTAFLINMAFVHFHVLNILDAVEALLLGLVLQILLSLYMMKMNTRMCFCQVSYRCNYFQSAASVTNIHNVITNHQFNALWFSWNADWNKKKVTKFFIIIPHTGTGIWTNRQVDQPVIDPNDLCVIVWHLFSVFFFPPREGLKSQCSILCFTL